MIEKILDGIWEVYKSVVVAVFTIYLFLFFIVGGEFSIEIKWGNVVRLWESLKRYFS